MNQIHNFRRSEWSKKIKWTRWSLSPIEEVRQRETDIEKGILTSEIILKWDNLLKRPFSLNINVSEREIDSKESISIIEIVLELDILHIWYFHRSKILRREKLSSMIRLSSLNKPESVSYFWIKQVGAIEIAQINSLEKICSSSIDIAFGHRWLWCVQSWSRRRYTVVWT